MASTCLEERQRSSSSLARIVVTLLLESSLCKWYRTQLSARTRTVLICQWLEVAKAISEPAILCQKGSAERSRTEGQGTFSGAKHWFSSGRGPCGMLSLKRLSVLVTPRPAAPFELQLVGRAPTPSGPSLCLRREASSHGEGTLPPTPSPLKSLTLEVCFYFPLVVLLLHPFETSEFNYSIKSRISDTVADLLGGHHRLAMFSGKLKLPWWYKLSWRNPKVLPILFVIEFPFTVACLALFGIADPDTYRTSLWQEGSIHGWNSDPQEILYAYANYKPIPVPAPWNQLCVLRGPDSCMRTIV